MEYADFIEQWHDSRDYIVSKTSGSTGKPKEIRLPKEDMRRSALASVRMFGLNADSTIASALPVTSIATKMAIVRHLVAGCRYVTINPSNNFELNETISLLSIAPTQADCLIANPQMLRMTGHVLVGGAALGKSRRDALLDIGYKIYESYGMTETCSNVALRTGADEYFTANPGITFCTDSRDCITVHAPGYSFDGIVTNDVAELLSPTRFRLLGRYDNAINSGGIKLFPETLEHQLAGMIDHPYYITGIPDEKWGNVAVLVIEGSVNEAMATAEKLSIIIKNGVQRPKYVAASDKFQYTETGKIKRIAPDSMLFATKTPLERH